MPTRRSAVLRPLCLAALLFAPASALGGELDPPPGPVQATDATRLNAQTISLPYVIDEPGAYILTSNLDGQPGQYGIIVSADNVTIDLNGFTLQGDGGEGGHGVFLTFNQDEVRPFTDLTVTNGHIDGWGGDGINGEGEHILVDRVTVTNNTGYGIRVSIGNAVRHCIARGNGAIGIFGHLTSVENCVSVGNGDVGIKTVGGSIVNCTASLNLADGLRAFDGGVIADSASFNNQIGIIAVDGSVVKNCSTFNNFEIGISASNGSTVHACGVRGNFDAGVVLETGSSLIDSTISNNLSDGVRAERGCRVENNTIDNHSAGAGVLVTGQNNRIDGNNITGGQTGVRVEGENNFVVRNTVSDIQNHFQINTGNAFGPIVNVSGNGSMAGALEADHPWANFLF